MKTPCLAIVLAAAAAAASAQDRADIDRTQIIGNSELPKVLYIVPWKKPLPGPLTGRPVRSVLDEALAPIERDVFRREIAYDTQLQAKADPKDTKVSDGAKAPPSDSASRQPASTGARP